MFDMGNECRHQNNYITIPLGALAPNLARLMGHCLDGPLCISCFFPYFIVQLEYIAGTCIWSPNVTIPAAIFAVKKEQNPQNWMHLATISW